MTTFEYEKGRVVGVVVEEVGKRDKINHRGGVRESFLYLLFTLCLFHTLTTHTLRRAHFTTERRTLVTTL